jgi:hypothetical protein
MPRRKLKPFPVIAGTPGLIGDAAIHAGLLRFARNAD